jgi:hypothetical protein
VITDGSTMTHANGLQQRVDTYTSFKVIVEPTTIRIMKPSGLFDYGEIDRDPLKWKTVRVLRQRIEKSDKTTREELEVLGSHLFNILFDLQTRNVFKTAYDQIRQDETKGLRVILEFTRDAQELATLPWEYIFYPDDDESRGFFIGVDSQLILARHVPLTIRDVAADEKPPLRILLVVSKPRVDTEGREFGTVDDASIRRTLSDLKDKHGNTIIVHELLQPTKRSFTQKVQEVRPHVVHFIGHGKHADDVGYLAFIKEQKVGRDPSDTAAWIRDADLADAFNKVRPHLMFLHACEGAASDSYRAFRGVALQMVYSRVRAVVAMQYKIPNLAANMFAERFYRSLGEGNDIDVAVQDGRLHLGLFEDGDKNFGNPNFGCPVVYVQSADKIIIAESKVPGSDESLAPPPRAVSNAMKVPCPYGNCQSFVQQGDVMCDYGHHPLPPCENPVGCPNIVLPLMRCRRCGWLQGRGRPAEAEGAAAVSPQGADEQGRAADAETLNLAEA